MNVTKINEDESILYEIFHSMRDEYFTRGIYELISYLNYYFDTSNAEMVELGSYGGQSTAIFSQYFKKVTAIDPWEDYEELPTYKMEQVERTFDKFVGSQKNVEKRKGYSVEESKTFEDRSLDFVYIDARHEEEYVLEDIETWLPKLKKNGFIGGHDFYLYPTVEPWVGKAVLSKFNKDDIIIFADCSWLTKAHNINPEVMVPWIPLNSMNDTIVHDGKILTGDEALSKIFTPMKFCFTNFDKGLLNETIRESKQRKFEKWYNESNL